MKLVIMTRGRVNNQRTWESIPTTWHNETYFLVPPAELQAHMNLGRKAIAYRHPSPNYSNKFQFILENLFPDDDKIVILDDDLVFSKRVQLNDKVTLKTLKDEAEIRELDKLFNSIYYHLDEVPQVGVHPRQMGHQAPAPYKEIGKVIVVNAVNRKMLREMGFGTQWRVDHAPILADTFLNCNILARGHKNRLLTNFCVDWGASQAPGGCDYRTMEMQEQAIDKLVEHFGPYVKKVIKKPKQAKWLGEERVDYRAQWKQLYLAKPLAQQ